MTAPLPAVPPEAVPPEAVPLDTGARTLWPVPADRPALRILPVPETEPPFDPDPCWDRPRLRAVRELPLDWTGGAGDAPGGAQPEPPSGPPGARRAAWRLVNAYLDVLHGRRPWEQLLPTSTPDGAEWLRRELAGPPQPTRRVRMQSLHVAEPTPGSAEVVVVLADHRGVWALALHLLHRDGTWRCDHFETV